MLKRFVYTREQLTDAVESDIDSKAAERNFKIPASTIRQHRREPSLNARAGRPSYLTTDQECYFVSLLKLLPDYGFEVAKDVALELATEYFTTLNIMKKPGIKWLNLFVKRHADDIKWKKQEKLERIRAEAFTEETRVAWFRTVKDIMIQHNLLDKPNQIFNADESGFSDKTKGQWVIVNSSTRHIFETSGGGGRDYRTALICINAGGQVLPPFIIYSGKNLMDTWCRAGPMGAQYAVTTKGWIDTSKYEFWLENLFIPSTAHINRPLLLIIDGHASHISLKIIDLLRKHQIICLMLPSHCTHALQPLDVVLFNSVKNDWSQVVRNHMKDGNKNIKNAHFPNLMRKLFIDKAAFSTTRIVSSFARAGIWPFDENAMRDKVARNTTLASTTSSTSISCSPTNILQSATFTTKRADVSTETNPQRTCFSPNIVDQTTSLQPTLLIDDNELIHFSGVSSYTSLQSCPLDLSLNPELNKRKLSTSDEVQCKSVISSSSDETSSPSTSTPIIAVRHVMNNLLSQRATELERTILQPKPVRGKRLTNNTGMNITDDEFIYMKIKENEVKKLQKQKSSNSKKTNIVSTSSSTGSTTKKRRGRPPKRKPENDGKTHSNHPETDASIRSLNSVIEMADDILNDDDSNEEWD